METGQYPSERRKLDWGRQLRRSMAFDDHPFGILACRALDYAQIISRFVRLDACELHPGAAFYVVGLCHFRVSRTQCVFTDVLHRPWRKRGSIWPEKCM